ncbi:hypothetical protein BDZ94DRAFT_713673 [Collybia nuda]|uniref:Uncharacterized protein n=1 Tax=Collybia nuda TaxID=64659 RepID=A0A9P5Y6K9_9AGAR|nr:hypothetical protein BDZ94DRAFT_713673 [Collybia nuda]
MQTDWAPKRSLAEVDTILCGPGSIHETEVCLVDGTLQRVFKNLWPSLRAFWLWASHEHLNTTYVVFEKQRLTFSDVLQHSIRAAAVYQDVFGIKKGDRVAICSRNYPEYLVAFWACHLIGAVSVLVNAWLPIETMRYCLTHTQSKLIILDAERADRVEPVIREVFLDAHSTGCMVLESHEGKGSWRGMKNWKDTMNEFNGDINMVLKNDPVIIPEDNATIIFTSGTTGQPKGVLSTQRMYLTNVLNVLVAGRRAILRRGGDIPDTIIPDAPQKGILVSVPLFHVTGLNSHSMLASIAGIKIVFMRKWIPEEAARLIQEENISIAGGVPSMVSDLIERSGRVNILETLMFGGASPPNILAEKARVAFPAATMSQGYGLTETNSVAVSVAGEDYISRPSSCGRPTLVNDIVIVSGNLVVPSGTVGEVWLRGPNIMKGYWNDPDATEKALTKDGWLRTGDLGVLDKEGFLHIKDRIKDIIIRGGENIDSVSVENALYADERVYEAAAVGVPHKRLGEVVAAVVYVKPENRGQVTEASLMAIASKSLPKFAVPVMIVFLHEPFERTPSGKILKGDLRTLARKAWSTRNKEPTSKL